MTKRWADSTSAPLTLLWSLSHLADGRQRLKSCQRRCQPMVQVACNLESFAVSLAMLEAFLFCFLGVCFGFVVAVGGEDFVYFGVSWVFFNIFVGWEVYMGRIEPMDTSSETSSQAKDNWCQMLFVVVILAHVSQKPV